MKIASRTNGIHGGKKTIHDKDMVFAMVILHIIWICNGYTPYHIHIQLLPHSFIPSLSR
jgi:hypothetical protein